jgi:hypothetical protein
VLLFRRSTPGRSLRPFWHRMVNRPSTGAVLFAVTCNAWLTYADVLGQPLSRVPASFYIPSQDPGMGDGATRGVHLSRK